MMRTLPTIATLISLWLPTSISAQERTWEWHPGMHPFWWMWGAWGIGMMLTMLAFWGLVIVGLVVGIRWLMTGLRPSSGDRALDILAAGLLPDPVVVTHEFGLEDYREAIETAIDRKRSHAIKVVFRP